MVTSPAARAAPTSPGRSGYKKSSKSLEAAPRTYSRRLFRGKLLFPLFRAAGRVLAAGVVGTLQVGHGI